MVRRVEGRLSDRDDLHAMRQQIALHLRAGVRIPEEAGMVMHEDAGD